MRFTATCAGRIAAHLALLALVVPALCQVSASVSVNAGSSLGTIPSQAFGVNTAVWDGNLLDTNVPTLLKQAGVTMLRFPGGSTSDVYHWQTNTSTSGTGAYVNPNDTFDNFMTVVKNTGATAIVTVNYGSNAAGTAGGDPTEAANWVKYANVTKGYGVKYWEIGNEIYGNGEYGSAWEEDLHSDHSPTAYGNNCLQFISQMKAQDSTIKVGVVLCAPGNWPDGVAPDWNSNVLAACGTKIDFVIVHWYAQGPGSESDSGLLASTGNIASMVSTLRSEINQYCGTNASNVQIVVSESNSVSYNPGKQTVSLVNGLFLADDYMDWLEHGVTTVDWWDLHNGISTGNNNSSSLYGTANYGDYGILSNGSSSGGISEPAAETPFPPYYGLQMLSYLGKPNDTMVSSSSDHQLLVPHAVNQANGSLALLLINKDPSNSYNANVSLSGFTPSGSGTQYTYGENSSSISSSSKSGLGSSFTVTVSPYSLNTIVLTPASTSNPTFTASASVSPSTVSAGATTTISATVTCSSGSLSNGIVDLEVYNSAGTKVAQTYFTGQSFSTNQSHSYTWTYTTSTTTGTYTVKIGVFNSTWATNYYWNNGAATITVVTADSAQYNFESGTQGWATSGGMITSVASSTANAYAGTHSLAVSFNGSGSDTQQAYVSNPSTPAGKVVTFHVWFPAGSKITAIQPYVQQGASGGWTWTGNYQSVSNLTAGAWNTITVTVPSNAVTPLYQLGVQFFTNAAWTGTCYVDSISW